MKLPVGTLAIGSWPRKRTSAKVPLSAMNTSAALAKKTGQETVIDRWYRSVQNPLFNPRVMISRLPILTMLDQGFFEIRRNGCIDLLPARSNDLWTDLVTASRLHICRCAIGGGIGSPSCRDHRWSRNVRKSDGHHVIVDCEMAAHNFANFRLDHSDELMGGKPNF